MRRMEPELETLLAEVDAVRLRVGALTEGLDESAFNWSPAPGAWSVAQCLEHLNVSANQFFRVIDRGLQTDLRGTGPFRYGPFESWFLRIMEPPVTFKVKARKRFVPPARAARASTLEAFLRHQDEMVERIRRADGLHLQKIKVNSPVANWLKYSLGIALRLKVAHERRHVWQAEQVRVHPSFPRSESRAYPR